MRKILLGLVLALAGWAGAEELSGGAITTRTALRNAPAVFAEKGKGRIAFLGGSITEGNYFRPIVTADLQRRFPSAALSFTVAGLSSTCSTAGAFRFQEDILSKGVPDVLFVEFAVNDDQDGFAGHSYDDCVRGMEGIVRQARRANPKMDIVMILFTNANELTLVRNGQVPVPYAGHIAVAEHYGIPTINLAKALANAESAGTFSWQAYGADCHPNAAGSQFGADLVVALLENQGWGSSTATVAAYSLPEPLNVGAWDRGCWIDPMSVRRGAGWNYSTPDWAALTGCRANYTGQDILWSTTPGSTCSFKFSGTDISAFVLAGPDAGMLEISVDGDAFIAYDLYSTAYSRSLQYPYTRVFRQGLADAEHTVTFRVGASKNAASTGTAVRLYRVGVNGTPDPTRQVSANGVTWSTPCDVAGEADVDKTGVLRYAYGVLSGSFKGNTDHVIGEWDINGVRFVGDERSTTMRCMDMTLEGFTAVQSDINLPWAASLASNPAFTLGYRALLGNGSAGTGTGTLVFNSLVPGRRYLIQLWCHRGTVAAAGEKITVDGVVDLATGDPDGAVLGQHVKGTFRATSSTLRVALKGSNNYTFFNGVQLRDISSDEPIAWGAAKDCTADADVETAGVLRYAYADNAVTINGVPFAGTLKHNFSPNGNLESADLAGTGFSGTFTGTGTFCKNFTATATMTSAYQKLVGGSISTPLWGEGKLTLKNLLPNHTYLVQLWVNDSRATPGDVRSERVDDGPILRYRRSNGLGQHVTGTFIATSEERTISFTPFTDSSVQSASQVNAIQVRDLTPGIIAWEGAKNIAADTDIRTDGITHYAYNFGQGNAVVNGVTFRCNNTSAQGLGESVELTGFSSASSSPYCGANATNLNLKAGYTQLLRGGRYTTSGGRGKITLKQLTPGARYLVQVWVNDSRVDGPYRAIELDGTSRLMYRASGSNYGQHMTGTFTAESTNQVFYLRSLATLVKDNGFRAGQFNALQVRRIGTDVSSKTEWQVNEISQFDADAFNDGTLAYAYIFGSTAVTFNGIPFAAAGSAAKADLNGHVGFGNFSGANSTAFFNANDPSTSAAYKSILKTAWFSSNGVHDSPVTLKGLTPGHRYRVQLWVNDFRDTPGLVRYQTVDGAVTMDFKKLTGAPSRGDFATGLFTATAATQTINLRADSRNSVACAAQLNALQVRDLGEVPAEPPASWTVPAETLLHFDGTTVSPAGTFSRIVAGRGQVNLGASSLVEGADVAVAGGATVVLTADAAPTLGRLSGEGTVSYAGELEVANADVNTFSGTLAGDVTLRKTGVADYFLGGACTGALALDVQRGTLWLTTQAARGVTLQLAEGSAVELGGITAQIGSLVGDGRLANGTLAGACDVTGQFVVENLAFDDSARVVLKGVSTLAVDAQTDLDGVEVRIEDPARMRREGTVFISSADELVGEPAFTYGQPNFSAVLTEDGRGYTIAYTGTLTIFIR